MFLMFGHEVSFSTENCAVWQLAGNIRGGEGRRGEGRTGSGKFPEQELRDFCPCTKPSSGCFSFMMWASAKTRFFFLLFCVSAHMHQIQWLVSKWRCLYEALNTHLIIYSLYPLSHKVFVTYAVTIFLNSYCSDAARSCTKLPSAEI